VTKKRVPLLYGEENYKKEEGIKNINGHVAPSEDARIHTEIRGESRQAQKGRIGGWYQLATLGTKRVRDLYRKDAKKKKGGGVSSLRPWREWGEGNIFPRRSVDQTENTDRQPVGKHEVAIERQRILVTQW